MTDSNQRKLEHIKIVNEMDVEPTPSPFTKYALPFKSLPDLSLEEIDTSIEVFGFKLNFPFFISSMTGGPEKGKIINRNVAEAAEEMRVGFGLGSMRVIIKHPETIASFDVKKYAPNVPMFANLGLVQLNYGFGLDEILRIIDSVKADGIFLHINPLQEAVQPEGDTNYKGLVEKLAQIIDKIPVPIIIKEVGCGIDVKTAKNLSSIGVKWIDVSGSGGTSWPWVEGYRRDDDLGYIFRDYGIPTDLALQEASQIPNLNLIAGGGIRSGLDIAKSIPMGAKLATAAKPFLSPALESPEKVIKVLKRYENELKVAMFVSGSKNLEELSKQKISLK